MAALSAEEWTGKFNGWAVKINEINYQDANTYAGALRATASRLHDIHRRGLRQTPIDARELLSDEQEGPAINAVVAMLRDTSFDRADVQEKHRALLAEMQSAGLDSAQGKLPGIEAIFGHLQKCWDRWRS